MHGGILGGTWSRSRKQPQQSSSAGSTKSAGFQGRRLRPARCRRAGSGRIAYPGMSFAKMSEFWYRVSLCFTDDSIVKAARPATDLGWSCSAVLSV